MRYLRMRISEQLRSLIVGQQSVVGAQCELYVMHFIRQRSTHSSLRYGGNLSCNFFQGCGVRLPRSAEQSAFPD
jgi:hypothetical protein